MKVLNYRNANVTVDAAGGDLLGGTTQQLVANVTLQFTTRPVEIDLAAGAYWIWPIRQATITIAGTLPPGVSPQAVPASFAPDTVTIQANDLSGGAMSPIVIGGAYLSGIRIGTENIGGDAAMPALTQQLTYVFFIDDDGTSGDY